MNERFNETKRVLSKLVLAGAIASAPVAAGCEVTNPFLSPEPVFSPADDGLGPDSVAEYLQKLKEEMDQLSLKRFNVSQSDLNLLARLYGESKLKNIDPNFSWYITQELPAMSPAEIELQVQKTPICGFGGLPSDNCYELLISSKGERVTYSSAVLKVWVYAEGFPLRLRNGDGKPRTADIFYSLTRENQLGKVHDWDAIESGMLEEVHITI